MLKTTKWNFAEYLKSEKDINVYLKTVFENGEPSDVAAALGNVARARRMMSKIAKKIGHGRESLYKSLSKNTKPYFGTINNVVNALGYKLTVIPQRA
ncbi:MAG: putative addiction module antidote protein [Candidatus Margulisbacteria bacterium]|jgi:probable addiction module antidote protein|nr:putative addiction module antidote protein [Candidatus Margulisiibacteriota bacterium]